SADPAEGVSPHEWLAPNHELGDESDGYNAHAADLDREPDSRLCTWHVSPDSEPSILAAGEARGDRWLHPVSRRCDRRLRRQQHRAADHQCAAALHDWQEAAEATELLRQDGRAGLHGYGRARAER